MGSRKPSILLVDHETDILRLLQRHLVAYGYEVLMARSGGKAQETVLQHPPHLMVVDLELPGMSGFELCKWVRARSSLPIIVLSESDKEHDKVHAFDLGVDDYILKPFGILEMLARIRVALRHVALIPSGTEPTLTIGPIHVDFTQRRVTVNKQEVELTPTEYDLFRIFIQNRDKIMTRQMLLTQVWGTNHDGKTHSLHVYIGQLRRKIEPDPAHPRFFLTITGVGYCFSIDDQKA